MFSHALTPKPTWPKEMFVVSSKAANNKNGFVNFFIGKFRFRLNVIMIIL